MFYHRPPRGFGNARQPMVAPVRIEWDKKPVSRGGQVRITGYDTFAKTGKWTARANDGNEYTGAEVTSEGFQIFGLPPYGYYSAGIACYMAGPGSNEYMQDNHDVWRNGMDLAGLRDGSIIGFKYFNFEGLNRDQKGVKAFKGFDPQLPTNAVLLHLTTEGGEGKFRVHVRLDAPDGQEIATIDEHRTDKAVTRSHSQLLSKESCQLLGSLKGKHAIFLVVEGPDAPKGLFTLHGFGFVAGDAVLPVVPQMAITVDGQRLNIPANPLRSTNQNGYTEVNRYQLYAPLTQNSTLKATADSPDVKITVSPITEGRATIRATYKGQEKIFLIN